MSEGTAQVADNQTPAPPPAPVIPQPITKEYLDDLKAKGDTKGLNEAIDRMTNPKPADVPPPPPADQEVQVNKDQQVVDQGKKKIFTTVVRGQEVEYPDSDNYFGYGDFGKMKKSFVHAKEDYKFQRKQAEGARQAAIAATQEKEKIEQQLIEAQKQMKDIENKLAAQPVVPPQPAVTATPPSAPPAPAQPPLTPVDKPIPPEPLNIPADPGNWVEDDIRKKEEYDRKVTAFHKNSAAYLDYVTELVNRKQVQQPPVIKSEIPAEYKNQVKNLSEQLNMVTQKLKKSEEESAAEEAKRHDDAFWNSISNFKDQHKTEFGGEDSFDVPPKDMSKQTLEWTDSLAQTLGAKQPYKPYNTQDPEWIDYENRRLQAVNDYLDEKPETLKAVEGVAAAQPPKGYKKYYGILKVRQLRDQYIQNGILGSNATLHDAWVKMKDGDGTFDTVFSKIQTDAQVDTANQIFDHLQNQQAEHATTIPNEFQSPVPDSAKISKGDRDRILGLTTEQLLANPEDKKRHDMLLAGQLEIVA